MKNIESKFNRRDLFKFGGAAAALGTAVLGPKGALADKGSGGGGGGGSTGGVCSGLQAIEVWPTSPFILNPFTDPLTVPTPLTPDPTVVIDQFRQDTDNGVHQIMPSQMGMPNPIGYRIKLQVDEHAFTSSQVMNMKNVFQNGNLVKAAGAISSLPKSTIYGFNGTFPGPMIYARYGQPSLVRFENHLDQNPKNLDRQDFGAPDWSFLTHLHNAHTAPESDGNPHYRYMEMPSRGAGYQPGEFCDNLYLNWPAGGDDREKQSFFWFHDHKMDHTGANVYKGMVGLYPIYDPVLDHGDETKGLRLPGVPNSTTGRVDYDIPLAFYDCRLEDGNTQHQDFHNGCGELHPEWWGKTFFRHFPDHGFVGDIFTVNGTAYPVYHVKRRNYRFRFLDCSISRIYELKMMKGGSPVAAPGTDGQWQLPGGQQCMRFTQIAADGGLLSSPIIRDSFQVWPAKRKEMVVDFSKYQDGSPTSDGEVIYMVNTCKMSTGRMPDSADPNYKVPVIKFIIDGSPVTDNSMPLTPQTKLRDLPVIPNAAAMSGLTHRTFTFQRGSAGGETQWLVNGKPFDPTVPMAYVKRGVPEVWTFQNGGGGWVHPVHIHMEEHRIQSRTGILNPDDPYDKEDVVALGPSETVTFYRNFRTFTGPYVAHCHNLAHEDHAMMFGWSIIP